MTAASGSSWGWALQLPCFFCPAGQWSVFAADKATVRARSVTAAGHDDVK